MQTKNLVTALEHAEALLSRQPLLAISQAQEILQDYAGEPNALRILGASQRQANQLDASRATLQKLAGLMPNFALAHEELGLTLLVMGEGVQALREFELAVNNDAKLARSWKALGDLHAVNGSETAAQAAYQKHLEITAGDPVLVMAANYLYAGKLAKCEKLCREFLYNNPTNVSAIRILAEAGIKLGRLVDAEKLLQRCLQLAPDFHPARNSYAEVLFKLLKYEPALAELEKLRVSDPNNPNHLLLKASVLGRIGDHAQAIEIYAWVLSRFPRQARIHLSHGHALKTVGRQDDAIAAYRRCIELQPKTGEAYWSLANLKTFRFTDDDLVAMEQVTIVKEIDRVDFYHLCFALGKALEDREEYERAFFYYRLGNKARRETVRWDADQHHNNCNRIKTFFSTDLFTRFRGAGDPAADPIFIVGLPRAGSTLLEQILASHSAVEGTMELPDIIAISRRLNGRRKADEPDLYPEILGSMSPPQLAELGREYLDRTRIHRVVGRPFFIDKMPNNFPHIGLIHLILPRAKIIDARRHPMACCFSGFKQLFASGQDYTYDPGEIGRYYKDYVELMAHWDKVLPGVVLRVNYEEVVANTEAEVRRILSYCNLPFEAACLEFHATERAVRTASSEQVRQPIYGSGVDQWQNFSRFLDPLREALGPELAD